MTTEECLEIVKKLDNISKNKFYTVNVYDVPTNRYLGECEVITSDDKTYNLVNNFMFSSSILYTVVYTFAKSGQYTRSFKSIGKISDILSRLDTIEQKLGI